MRRALLCGGSSSFEFEEHDYRHLKYHKTHIFLNLSLQMLMWYVCISVCWFYLHVYRHMHVYVYACAGPRFMSEIIPDHVSTLFTEGEGLGETQSLQMRLVLV